MAKETEKKDIEQAPSVDIDAIIAEKTAEALAIARKEWEAEAEAKTKATKVSAGKAAEPKIDPMEERVTVHLFKGEGFEKPRFVAVNGETCRIPRGKPVQIKRKFALVLENSDRQDSYALDLMKKMQDGDQNLGDLTRK